MMVSDYKNNLLLIKKLKAKEKMLGELYTIFSKELLLLVIQSNLPKIQDLMNAYLAQVVDYQLNMDIDKKSATTDTLELFVKILTPKEKFKIDVPFANGKEKQFASKVPQHLLICSERVFSNSFIEMPHFIENIQRYNFGYSGTKVVIPVSNFMSFILRQR